MAILTSLYSTSTTEIPASEGILNVVRVKDNEVRLHWEGYVGPPGVFLVTRRASRKTGPYEVRGTTRTKEFNDHVPAGEWFKYRLEFIAD